MPLPQYSDVPPVTGYESPSEAREAGWLGQVPPPSSDKPAAPAAPAPTTYAVPALAPEPWKDQGSLYLDDPTLFG